MPFFMQRGISNALHFSAARIVLDDLLKSFSLLQHCEKFNPRALWTPGTPEIKPIVSFCSVGDIPTACTRNSQ
jgi:hypothetical protein